MDEKSATVVCDQFEHAKQGTQRGSTLPMYLVVVNGGIPGAMLRLVPGGTRLGRSADNTFQLLESSISRHHALFRTDDKGNVWLSDLASTNGTFLNGRRLPRQAPTQIKDGDRVQLGSSVMVKFVRLDPCEEQFQREMYERSVRDPLTALYNRSYFLSQAGSQAELGALRGLGLAILMLDLDRFKRINDTYGHLAGDVVLFEVAGILRESTRPEDLVARYGGEEFVLALPVAAPDLATERAERIRANLAERRIDIGGQVLRVTASLGLAYSPPGRTRSILSLIAVADRGLLQAKRLGRDRVIFSGEPALVAPELSTDTD